MLVKDEKFQMYIFHGLSVNRMSRNLRHTASQLHISSPLKNQKNKSRTSSPSALQLMRMVESLFIVHWSGKFHNPVQILKCCSAEGFHKLDLIVNDFCFCHKFRSSQTIFFGVTLVFQKSVVTYGKIAVIL